MRRLSSFRIGALIGFAVGLVALIAVTVWGGSSIWLPMVWAICPWTLVAWRRLGVAAALAGTVLGLLAFALLGLILTAAIHVPIVTAFLVASAALGVAGALVALRLPPGARPTLSRTGAAIAPALGAVVWLAVLGIARVRPGSAVLSWVMSGDSANNVLFARVDLAVSGIRLGPQENPVPLPAGLISLGASAGRAEVSSHRLLGHDLAALASLWGVVIAVLCVLIGAAAAASISASRPVMRTVVGALASLVPLSWFVVGYPVEYGFLNTHVALLVVLSGWLAFVSLSARPALLIALLALCCTLTLAVWSPVVLFPGLLMVVVIVRRWAVLPRQSRRDLVIGLIGLAQLLAFFLGVTIPSLVAQSGFLAAGGGAYAFSKWVLIASVAAAVVVGIAARRPLGATLSWALLAMGMAAVIGWGALLFLARGTPDALTSYYPLKFAWLSALVLLVVVLGTVLGVLSRWTRRAVVTAIAVAVVAVAVVGVLRFAPTSSGGYAIRNPVARILTGDFIGSGDTTVDRIVRYADLQAPTLLIGTHDRFESTIDFWVLQMQANSVSNDSRLRKAAYGVGDLRKPAQLCLVLRAMGAPTTVLTQDPTLGDRVRAACPDVDATVRPLAAG